MDCDGVRGRNLTFQSHFEALPVEIVTQIFLDIRDCCSSAFSKDVTDITLWDDIMTLPLVSRQWNTAALSTPWLWNWVVLKRNVEKHKAELIRRLDRSAPVLIDIYAFVDVKVEPTMDILLPYLDRWGYIKFCEKSGGLVGETPTRQVFEWMLSLPLPHLHSLEVCTGMGISTTTMIRAPQLKLLHVPWGAAPVLPTKESGTTLDSFEISWERQSDLYEILQVVARSADTLHHLLIETFLGFDNAPSLPVAPPILCRNLRDLTLEFEAWFILGSLGLPVLESLAINRFPPSAPTHPVSSLPHLQSLYWPESSLGGRPTIDDLEVLLLAAPNITSFREISGISQRPPQVASEALMLVGANGRPRYCPGLEHLSLGHASLETIQRIVTLRPNLKSVSVETLTNQDTNCRAPLSYDEWQESRELAASIAAQVLLSIPEEYSW